MKLLIKKKYFDQIRQGKKKIEFRDAHITFVAEETGETLKKDVIGVSILPRKATELHFQHRISNDAFNKLFDDNSQIWFYLEDGGQYEAKNNA